MSRGAIPIELCNVIPGQIMRKQFPEDKTNEMVEFARKVPAERLAAIKAGLDVITALILCWTNLTPFQLLKYEKSPYVQQFGMDISKSPMTLTARVLNPPMLRYGGGGTQATIVRFHREINLYLWCYIFSIETCKWTVEYVCRNLFYHMIYFLIFLQA